MDTAPEGAALLALTVLAAAEPGPVEAPVREDCARRFDGSAIEEADEAPLANLRHGVVAMTASGGNE